MRPSLSRTHLAVIAIVVVALAGCGGSGYPSSADNVCKSYDAKFRALANPTTVSGYAAYLGRVAALLREASAKLAAVKPPSSKRAAYGRFVAVIDSETAVLDAASAQARTHPAQAIARLQQVGAQIGPQSRAAARAAGLKVCGNGRA